MQIQDNVFIITGGASGLGAATARILREHHAEVHDAGSVAHGRATRTGPGADAGTGGCTHAQHAPVRLLAARRGRPDAGRRTPSGGDPARAAAYHKR